MTDNAKNLWQRLAEAQSKVDYIQKEKKPGMQYSIVSHDAVTAKVRPVLVECGIYYHPVAVVHTQNGNRTEVAMTVRFVNVDKPEEFIDVPSLGYGIDAQDKGPGKAISYAVKYALLKALGLETGDDPDLDQDAEHKPPASNTPNTFAATKAGSRDEFTRLNRELEAITRLVDLETWRDRNLASIEKLNDDFKDIFRNIYIEKQRELKAALAA